MQTDMSTMVILVAILLQGLIGALIARRIIHEKLQLAIDAIGGVLVEVFEKPAISRAMSVIGTKGGEARAETAVMRKIANDVLSGPKFAGLKMAASALGMDVDSYIEEHGAIATIQGLKGLGDMFGFDVQGLMSGEMNLAVGSEANGTKNPYL